MATDIIDNFGRAINKEIINDIVVYSVEGIKISHKDGIDDDDWALSIFNSYSPT